MYLCIISSDGEIVLHQNMKADPESLLKAIEPYRPDIVIGVECIFTWYWIADVCAEEEIPFTLGHALYMKAIVPGSIGQWFSPSPLACSIMEMTFIRPPHFGHLKVSMFQTFLRSAAHSCLLRREHAGRSFMEKRNPLRLLLSIRYPGGVHGRAKPGCTLHNR